MKEGTVIAKFYTMFLKKVIIPKSIGETGSESPKQKDYETTFNFFIIPFLPSFL
jgi:hypothetical protein